MTAKSRWRRACWSRSIGSCRRPCAGLPRAGWSSPMGASTLEVNYDRRPESNPGCTLTSPGPKRMRAWRTAFCAAALAIAGIAYAVPPSGTTTLVYDFSRSGFALAEMTDTLRVHAGEYELVSNAQGVGYCRAPGARTVAPSRKPGRDRRRRVAAAQLCRTARFQLSAERGIRLAGPRGRADQCPGRALPGTRCRQAPRTGYRLPINLPLRQACRRPNSASRSPTVGFLSTYAFRLVGTETVATGLGEVKALHYTKVLSGDDTAFDFWLGIEQQLLPVRVSYADKSGARFEQSLRAFHSARL